MTKEKSYWGKAYRVTAIQADFENSSWKYVLMFSLGWFLMPILIILSKLIKKEINFYDAENGKEKFITIK